MCQRAITDFAENGLHRALVFHHFVVDLTLNNPSYNTSYFSPMPRPLPDLGGGLTVLPLLLASFPSLPSAASLSKKSCHSSAKLSLLLELLAINIGSLIELRLGVLGVLRNGLTGTPSRELVPGRARPACSFCSVFVSIAIVVMNWRGISG